jgi:hypothetical protein
MERYRPMSNAAKKLDVEAQLLGTDEQVQALKRVSVQEMEALLANEISDEEIIFFNEDGTVDREVKPEVVLTGVDAMKMLGLPDRRHNMLTKGDLTRIRWKFKDWFEQLIKENQPRRDPETLFWDKIRVRVINKKNAGRQTRGCPSAGIAPGKYTGDVLTGEAIKAFLPETRSGFTNAGSDYFIQLLSITVSEELKNV